LIQNELNEKEAIIVNILLHSGSTLKRNIMNHHLVILNVEKLNGLSFCRKCVLSFRTSDHHRD
jgi:hypothetical protein